MLAEYQRVTPDINYGQSSLGLEK